MRPALAGRQQLPGRATVPPAPRQMIACPSRPAHNRDTERPGCGREEATSGVRVVMRDNVSADEPTRTSTRWGGGEALDGGEPAVLGPVATGRRIGRPQSEHTARHRPPVTPANTEWA